MLHLLAPVSHLLAQWQFAQQLTGPVTAFHDPVSTKLTTSAVIVYVLEVAKRSNLLPWITAHTKYMNRFVSIVAACASAVGIHFTFDHIAGTLMITGLSLATVLSALWAVLQQYCLQEIIYQGAVNKQPPPVVP